MKDLAIIVMSCDSYADLWDGFFKLKEEYWPDCPYDTYLVTNDAVYRDNGVKSITCGDSLNWTGRLLKALSVVPEQKILLMLEDYYISGRVDQKEIDDLIRFMNERNVSYYKLETRGTKFPKRFEKDYLRLITADIRYGVSLITSVWDKDFLLRAIGGEDYTAWEFEIRRNMKNDVTKVSQDLCVCDIRNILHIEHMVQRGKYLRKGIKNLNKKGHNIDFSKRGLVPLHTELYIRLSGALKNNRFIKAALKGMMKLLHIRTIEEKYQSEIRKKQYK